MVEELVNGQVTRQYTYGLQRVSEYQVVEGAWTASFYQYDSRGTVRMLTSAAGATTDTYEYDAFSNEISHTGTTPNNYLYRGEQWDPDLGLYYLRARWYNPATGRFMTRDPYEGSIYDPASLHRYNHARSNPVNFIDPSGRATASDYVLLAANTVARAAVVTAQVPEIATRSNSVFAKVQQAKNAADDAQTALKAATAQQSLASRLKAVWDDAEISALTARIAVIHDKLDIEAINSKLKNPSDPNVEGQLQQELRNAPESLVKDEEEVQQSASEVKRSAESVKELKCTPNQTDLSKAQDLASKPLAIASDSPSTTDVGQQETRAGLQEKLKTAQSNQTNGEADYQAKRTTADCAKKDFKGNQTLATEKYEAAETAARNAAKAAKTFADQPGTDGDTEQARAIVDQWQRAAEDIETFHDYLKLRYPDSASAGDRSQPEFGEELAQTHVMLAYYEILKMRSDLIALDQQVSNIFKDLNDDYRDIRVEQTDALPPFTGNAIERVSINVQRNYTPFTITGGATVGGAAAASSAPATSSASSSSGSGSGGGKGGAGGQGSGSGGSGSGSGGGGTGGQGGGGGTSNAATGSPSGSNDITVLLEVHRRATFNMVGGVMSIFVPTNSYAVVPEEAPYKDTGTTAAPTYQASESCGNGSPTSVNYVPTATASAPAPNQTAAFYCVQASQTGSVQVAGMAGIEWFPWGRDYFPHGRGVGTRRENWRPAALFASSVTSLGSAFAGGNLEPVNGLNFFAGIASAHQQTLPSGVLLTNVYQPVGTSAAAPTITPVTNVKWGFSFGVGFDLSVFSQLFTKTASPQLP